MRSLVGHRIRAAIVPALLVAGLTGWGHPASATPSGAGSQTTTHSMPFVENVGQFDSAARFQAHGAGGTLWITDREVWISVAGPATAPAGSGSVARSVPGANLRLTFPGANRGYELEPFDRLETHVSYFHGADRSRWRPDVPVWGGVRLVDLYPGVDLEWSGSNGEWQPRIVARAGADLTSIRLKVEGADTMSLEDGRLRLATEAGVYDLPLLRGASNTNATRAWLHGNEVFEPFGEVPEAQPAGAEGPEDLVYSGFFGGEREDLGQGIGVDAAGAAYITGLTLSSDLPVTPGGFHQTCGSCTLFLHDAFVAKVSPDGGRLEYVTYLGGEDYECLYSYAGDSCQIAVDADGFAYVAGFTESADFPTTEGAYDTTCNSCDGYFIYDGFVTKLNQTGTALVYSTFLGGSQTDEVHDIAVDATGAAYLTGRTTSTNFPVTPGAFQRTNHLGGYDSFVTKLSPDGRRLVYSTFLGGEDDDCHIFGSPYTSCGIAVDASGAAYLTGSTQSYEFPVTAGVYQQTCHSQCFFWGDAYVTKLNRTGSRLVYSTYLGGELEDFGQSIAVGKRGMAYVVGSSQSFDFPTTPGAFQPNFAGNSDAFVTALSGDGRRLSWSTYLGGPHDPNCPSCGDYGYDIAAASTGAVAVTGYTASFAFPVTPDGYQTECAGPPVMCGDAFVNLLSPDGTALLYGTYLGSGFQDQGDTIALDADDHLYVSGYAGSGEFPTTRRAFQTRFNGYQDAFVAKLDLGMAASG